MEYGVLAVSQLEYILESSNLIADVFVKYNKCMKLTTYL